jgi:hypothetical protein
MRDGRMHGRMVGVTEYMLGRCHLHGGDREHGRILMRVAECMLADGICSMRTERAMTECMMKLTECMVTECMVKLTECMVKRTECMVKLTECMVKRTECMVGIAHLNKSRRCFNHKLVNQMLR